METILSKSNVDPAAACSMQSHNWWTRIGKVFLGIASSNKCNRRWVGDDGADSKNYNETNYNES